MLERLKIHFRKQRVLRRLTKPVAKLRLVDNVNQFLTSCSIEHRVNAVSLDLGCGERPRNPFKASHLIGVDFLENPSLGVRSADLAISPVPCEEAEVDYVTAFDFLEHVPRLMHSPHSRFPFVELMNEIGRVLKPGGYFLSSTPVYPFVEIFQDPTHVNFISVNTFRDYFVGAKPGARIYGFSARFDLIGQALEGAHLLTLMRKPLSVSMS